MGKQWEQWQILFSWALKITVDGDCSHGIKRCLFLGEKAMANLEKKVTVKSLSHAQLFVTPWTVSLPGSSVHVIFQARVLEWVAISFSRVSSRPRDGTLVSCITDRHCTIWATREVQEYWSGLPCPSPGDHPNPRIEPAFLTSASDGGFFTTWEAPAKLDSVLKSRDITLPTKIHIVKAMVFTVVINRCESRTIKKVECQRTNAFELWCWRRLLRVPWTARRSTSQS